VTHHWFEDIADHAGSAYLRYSFTKGTDQEVDFLYDHLGLEPGMRLLDVGCGPGRHAHAFAARGLDVVGVDISQRFVELAAASGDGRFVRGDARRLPVATGGFDAAISLCQGGFGLVGERDADVVVELARAVGDGGRVAVAAFSAYFAVRFLEETDNFDAATGVNHERTSVRNEQGEAAEFDLWTSCFTPRELRLLAERAGLGVDALWSVTPGDYAERPPDLDHPEYLLLGYVAGSSMMRGGVRRY
jgi:SAM-dependent methyltransferase